MGPAGEGEEVGAWSMVSGVTDEEQPNPCSQRHAVEAEVEVEEEGVKNYACQILEEESDTVA